MKLVLDTNVYSKLAQSDNALADLIARTKDLFLPAVVVGELVYGFKSGSKFTKNMHEFSNFVKSFNVTIVDIDHDVAVCYGEIFSDLRKKGKPIPTNDVWVAACCMSIGGVLLTYDKHFHGISQIRIHNDL